MFRVEEINEDTLFFLITSGLEGRLNPGIRMNPSTHDERTFWSQVKGLDCIMNMLTDLTL